MGGGFDKPVIIGVRLVTKDCSYLPSYKSELQAHSGILLPLGLTNSVFVSIKVKGLPCSTYKMGNGILFNKG